MITAKFYFAGPLTGKNEGEIISKLKGGSVFTIWESNDDYMAGLRERMIATNNLGDAKISLDTPAAFLADLESLGLVDITRDEN